MRIKNVLLGLVIVAAILGAFWYGIKSDGDNQQADKSPPTASNPKANVKSDESTWREDRDELPRQGFRAPNFSVKTLDGKTVDLAKNGGKPTVLNFWESWCGPCRIEMPYFQKAYEKYGDQVNFFMVNGMLRDNMDNMKSYLESENYSFPIYVDETSQAPMMYEVLGIPKTVVIDAEGIIMYDVTGTVSEEQLFDMVKEVMKK